MISFLETRFAPNNRRSKWIGGRSMYWRKLLRRVRTAERAAISSSDAALLEAATEHRASSQDRSLSNEETVRATGLVGAAVLRTQGFRLYDVQIRAILAGSANTILEMQTGEGKTIVTGALAALHAMAKNSVHVATTNAYLAERDVTQLAPMFALLGLSVGMLPSKHHIGLSRRAYQNDIVYGPGYQFGFDYLRDQVTLRQRPEKRLGLQTRNRIRGVDPTQGLMQPSQHSVAIIDEADSVMIDEATTPLVISSSSDVNEDPTPFLLAHRTAKDFESGADFIVQRPDNRIEISPDTSVHAHTLVANRKNLQLHRPWRAYITNALRAIHVLQRDVDYVVRDGEIQIVDQYTGRIFSDRTWQDGLHQAVTVKEGLPIQSSAKSIARITRQRYLGMYKKLIGLTGTARTVADEFSQVYGCSVVPIPSNLKCIREQLPPRFFADGNAKLRAIADSVAEIHQLGRPILIGTKSIHETVEIQQVLSLRRLPITVLNGVQDIEEATVVSDAGSVGRITIATNMAGRGTDIKLSDASLELGGLHVIGVSPNDSQRIDRQLIGRAARQGNPGSSQFFAAATDDLFQQFAPGLAARIASKANALGESIDFSKELSHLQSRVERKNREKRRDATLRDSWMDQVINLVDSQS